MSYDPTDEVQVRDRKQKLKAERRGQLADLKAVLATPEGRRVFWRLLGHAGVYRSCFNSNALVMSHAEGARNEGLYLMTEILEADTDAYLLMQQESTTKTKKEPTNE